MSLPRLDSALRDRPWAYDDYPPVEDESVADPTAGLASLGYIATAIRRRLALVAAAALIGLFVGTAGYVLAPPAFQAEISLYLSTAPGQNPGQAMGTDVTLAQAHSVDAAVVRKLGLAESPSQLLASYTVTAETNEVMLIMTRAPSSAEAMREATAVATEFLKFRANQAATEQQAELATLNQQITQEKQQVAATTRQLTAAVAEPVSHGPNGRAGAAAPAEPPGAAGPGRPAADGHGLPGHHRPAGRRERSAGRGGGDSPLAVADAGGVCGWRAGRGPGSGGGVRGGGGAGVGPAAAPR